MTNELDALRAQVAMLRGYLEELRDEYLTSQQDPERGTTYKWSLTRIGYALAATESDAAAWLRKREKLAAADELDRTNNCFDAGKPVPSEDDKVWWHYMRNRAKQLRKEAEAGE